MPAPANREQLTLAGPAGELEALLETPTGGQPRAAVVVCHPHPLYQGTMHNKVAHTLARSAVRLGMAALRFNFRGTQASAGEFDGGEGEQDDVLAALAVLRQRYPDVPLWLAGFSFGAAMATLVAERAAVDGLVTVAPAVVRFASGLEGQPDCPWLIVQGDKDELVPVDDTLDWVNGLQPGPELLVMEGAEHFFHGRLNDLREAVMTFMDTHLPAD